MAVSTRCRPSASFSLLLLNSCTPWWKASPRLDSSIAPPRRCTARSSARTAWLLKVSVNCWPAWPKVPRAWPSRACTLSRCSAEACSRLSSSWFRRSIRPLRSCRACWSRWSRAPICSRTWASSAVAACGTSAALCIRRAIGASRVWPRVANWLARAACRSPRRCTAASPRRASSSRKAPSSWRHRAASWSMRSPCCCSQRSSAALRARLSSSWRATRAVMSARVRRACSALRSPSSPAVFSRVWHSCCWPAKACSPTRCHSACKVPAMLPRACDQALPVCGLLLGLGADLGLGAGLGQRIQPAQQAAGLGQGLAGLLGTALGDGGRRLFQGLAQGLLLRQGLFAHALPFALQALRHRTQGLAPGFQPLPVGRHLLGLGLGLGVEPGLGQLFKTGHQLLQVGPGAGGLFGAALADGGGRLLQRVAQGLLLRQGLFAHALPLALQAVRHRAQGLAPGFQPLPVGRHLLGLGLGFGVEPGLGQLFKTGHQLLQVGPGAGGLFGAALADGGGRLLQRVAQGLLLRQGLFAHALPLAL